MKRLFTMLVLLVGMQQVATSQVWTTPQVPGEKLETLSSSEVVYLYNVDADAFLINGMTWGTNACATRLTNGDDSESDPQRCHVFVESGKARISLKRYASLYLSCLSEAANDIYVDQNKNAYFAYTETSEGSHVYTLNNTTYKKDLDVTWDFGGHLTLVDGGNHTRWAFINESTITEGRYKAYKAKCQMYGLYKALADAGRTDTYSAYLDDARMVYESPMASAAEVVQASRTLFNAVYGDIDSGVDVSFLFDDADMVGSGDLSKWNAGGTFAWGEFEAYHNALHLTQTQTVPMGVYDVVLHALYREDGTGTAPKLVATGSNSVSAPVPAIGDMDYAVGNDQGNNWVYGTPIVPGGMQACGQALAHTNAVAWANGVEVGLDGKLTVSLKMESTSQWLNWQKVRLVYKGLGDASVRESLEMTISEAEKLYGDGTGEGAADLKTAIDKAKAVYDKSNASQSEIIIANSDLVAAMKTYSWVSASPENPVDVTEWIVNHSFEKGADNWALESMSLQSNTAFSLKAGNTYVEKWTGAGGKVGDGSVLQTIKGLSPGVYILKANAQNIQEGSDVANSGAWIVANNASEQVVGKDEYSVQFTNIEEEAVIGFKAEGATGNWLSVDNFRLYYAGGEFAEFKAELLNYLDMAKPYLNEKMQNDVAGTLLSCFAKVEEVLDDDNAGRYPSASTALRKAVEGAKVSIAAYEALAIAIADAESAHDESLNGAEKYLAAINKAKSVNDNLDATLDELHAQVEALDDALFEYRISNPNGTTPTVVTDKRYVRGAIAAFGRMSVSGVASTDILEQGFCWSTHADPTVLDNRTTRFLENNGRMYWMEMEPATVYYMRAYVITKGYAVGYGDVIKMSTLPRGRVTYWYNNGGDAAHNDRINNALTIATTYWSDYTSINGFNVSCTFSPGTPTADCGYGGGMRIGTNMGQRAGTCMHEMNHGIGGGTLDIWGGWSASPLRKSVNGYWAGDRANEAVRFWENNNNLVITGAYDGAHWAVVNMGEAYSDNNISHNKYPHNGAHLEPGAWAGPQNWNDTEVFYIGNSIINQGFCEDGLIPVNFYSGAFCLPAYVFEQDDNAKYYIKSESADHGLADSYLVEQPDGTLKWGIVQGTDGTLDDHAAWYITFTPDNQYYQFRNAATGHYLSFTGMGTNGIKAATTSTPAANEDFHLMRGRIDVSMGSYTTRGYWVIHPEVKANPATLAAAAGGATATQSLDLYDTATPQRWIFLKASELEDFSEGLRDAALAELDQLIKDVTALRRTSHHEDVSGADDELTNAIATIKAAAAAAATIEEVESLKAQTRKVGMDFLGKVTPRSVNRPFDITFLVQNAAIDDNTGWSARPTFSNSCCEYYQAAYDFNQTIVDLPAGTYQLRARAFQRPGAYTDAYDAYVKGNDNVRAIIYAGNDSEKLKHIACGARRSKLHDEDVSVGAPVRYIPNTMASAASYLALSTYDNVVTTSVEEDGASLKIGLKCTVAGNGYWTMFDNFRLYYYGGMTPEDVTSIVPAETDDADESNSGNLVPTTAYTLQGVQVDIPHDGSVENLPKGLYIVGGKKVVVK